MTDPVKRDVGQISLLLQLAAQSSSGFHNRDSKVLEGFAKLSPDLASLMQKPNEPSVT